MVMILHRGYIGVGKENGSYYSGYYHQYNGLLATMNKKGASIERSAQSFLTGS